MKFSIRLELILHLGKVAIGLLDLLLQSQFIFSKTCGKSLIGKSHHLNGKDGGILRPIYTHCSHWNARRHLYDAEHGVETVEHTLDRYTDYG